MRTVCVVDRISEEGVRHCECSVADHNCGGCRLPYLPASQSLLVTHMAVCICSCSDAVGWVAGRASGL